MYLLNKLIDQSIMGSGVHRVLIGDTTVLGVLAKLDARIRVRVIYAYNFSTLFNKQF